MISGRPRAAELWPAAPTELSHLRPLYGDSVNSALIAYAARGGNLRYNRDQDPETVEGMPARTPGVVGHAGDGQRDTRSFGTAVAKRLGPSQKGLWPTANRDRANHTQNLAADHSILAGLVSHLPIRSERPLSFGEAANPVIALFFFLSFWAAWSTLPAKLELLASIRSSLPFPHPACRAC